MLISEQLTKRLGRIFYRGSQFKNWNESLSYYKCFYVTTEPSYALYYATNEENNTVGYVTGFFLKKECNLFNANSDKDFLILNNFLKKYNTTITKRDLEYSELSLCVLHDAKTF